MNTLRKLIPVTLVCLAVVLGVAFADEESDRKERNELIPKIERSLEQAANELSGLESDSDAGDVNDALGYIREVESYVNDLSRVKGSDSTANNMVGYYPGYIRDFRSAAEELKKLKEKQRLAEQTVTTCKAFDQEMTQKAQNSKDEPRAAEELREFAKSVGRKGEDVMNEAQRKLSEVERHRDDAKRFSASDGKWSNVRSYMHSSADAVARIHKDDYEKARRECEEVIKRERHREVEKALGRLANSSTGRAELRKKINELLVTLSERVRSVESQSGHGYVRGAIEISKEIESQLERLRGAQGDDDEAKRIAANWPQWTRELRVALEALEEMKKTQNRADEGAGKCDTAERALQEKIRGYVGEPTQHEAAIRSLPEEADRIGNPIKSGIEKAGESNRSMGEWFNKARNFSQSEGEWSRVTSNLKDSADRVHGHWKEKYGAMVKSCERLVLGRDNPDVKKAVEEMSRDTSKAGENYRALRDEFNRWKADVDKLREFSEKDLEEVRKELCAATDADELGATFEIADRWAREINGLYGTITGTGDRIKRQADELVARKRALKAAPKVKDGVDKILASIAKLKSHQIEGSNNPMLKAYAAYGVKQHDSLQGSCSAKEITISSSYCENPNPKRRDCRLDCVKSCTVVEIKPSGAKSLGERQAEAYWKGLRKMYVEYKKEGKNMFEGKFSVFKDCEASDKSELKIDYRVEVYDFCPAATDLAPRIERVDVTIPSEAE